MPVLLDSPVEFFLLEPVNARKKNKSIRVATQKTLRRKDDKTLGVTFVGCREGRPDLYWAEVMSWPLLYTENKYSTPVPDFLYDLPFRVMYQKAMALADSCMQ